MSAADPLQGAAVVVRHGGGGGAPREHAGGEVHAGPRGVHVVLVAAQRVVGAGYRLDLCLSASEEVPDGVQEVELRD